MDREQGWQRNQGCVWLRAASVLSWEPGTGESEFCLDDVGIQGMCHPDSKQTPQRGISRLGTRQPSLPSQSKERMHPKGQELMVTGE